MIHELNLRLSPEAAHSGKEVKKECAARLGINQKNISDFRIISRSIDARGHKVFVNLKVKTATGGDTLAPDFEAYDFRPVSPDAASVVIVGAGPAGLFAALECIRLGLKPVVVERGKDVDARRIDLAAINKSGLVNPDSNYCFGEGGAGTYSDGKLYTRSKKRGDVVSILQILHQHGASTDILVDAHPHIGSEKLPEIIKNIRQTILRCGGEMHFSERVNGILVENSRVYGVVADSGHTYTGPIVLATGHSARDTYRMLHEAGVHLEAKGLAIGVRLEHPQNLIDCIQYHSKSGRGEFLPPAEYSFVTQVDGRGVYSFCMCPGGFIVPASSASGELVVNGMSPSNRGTKWANSGIVVEVRPGDFPEFAQEGVFEMMRLQEELEKSFFRAANLSLKAPAQRMKDFTERKISTTLPSSSYAPGLISAPVHFLLPPFISDRLREGLRIFGKRAKGFLTNEATVIGLESRTSSPVRIPRNKETLNHIEIEGLFPAGEGAGYAGGIVSAAIDGQRCAIAAHGYLIKNHQVSE